MSESEDYYALLGVAPDADAAVIRVAYRALMRRYHPDVNGSADAATNATAINEAYACLRDESSRAAYDWRSRPAERRATSRPSPAQQRPRPVWNGPTPRAEPPMPWFRPTWGKAIGLGVAAVITAITFTITSSIPPVEPAVASPSRCAAVAPKERSTCEGLIFVSVKPEQR